MRLISFSFLLYTFSFCLHTFNDYFNAASPLVSSATKYMSLDADSFLQSTFTLKDTNLYVSGTRNQLLFSDSHISQFTLISVSNSSLHFSHLTLSPPQNSFFCTLTDGSLTFSDVTFNRFSNLIPFFNVRSGSIEWVNVIVPSYKTIPALLSKRSTIHHSRVFIFV